MTAEVAAGIPIEFGTADDCLFEFGHLQAGETVLVQAGASGVGLAAVQLAKAAGATVIATASDDGRLKRLQDYGLDHGVNYLTGDVVAEVLAVTDRKGVDLVVDPVGGRTLEASIAVLAYRGRISWVGRAGREDAPPDIWPIMQRNASITGVFLGAEMAMNPARVRAMIERLIDRVAAGELRGRGRPRLPAGRGGRGPPLHREPQGVRAGASRPVTARLRRHRGRRGSQRIDLRRLPGPCRVAYGRPRGAVVGRRLRLDGRRPRRPRQHLQLRPQRLPHDAHRRRARPGRPRPAVPRRGAGAGEPALGRRARRGRCSTTSSARWRPSA